MEIMIDSREKRPFEFPERFVSRRTKLYTGDYSIEGFEKPGPMGIIVERKSLDDLVGCCYGSNRDRFEKEMDRMKAYGSRMVVVEASWQNILAREYRSRMEPNAIIGSIMSWRSRGIDFEMAGSRHWAMVQTLWYMRNAYKDRIRMISTLQVSS